MITYQVCGIPIAAVAPAAAAALIVQRAVARHRCQVHLCNAFTLSLVDDDSVLRAALLEGDLNLPDGAPVAWLGRKQGVREPVRGPRLVVDVCQEGARQNLRHYLYGGAPGVAEDVAQRLQELVSGVDVVMCEAPPYTDLSDQELRDLAERIRAAQANIVWIGLGTPRQDYLVPRLSPLVDAVVVPVGAAFDFLAGRINEAPAILQGSGFEWLYRLKSEPRRLWRRYLLGNPRFLAGVYRHRKRA